MADMIPRDAVLERMKSMAGCATCNNYNYVRCRACIWDDAMNIVDEAPTIDAIPVEWLRQFQDKMPNTAAVMGVDIVLKMWEKEAR